MLLTNELKSGQLADTRAELASMVRSAGRAGSGAAADALDGDHRRVVAQAAARGMGQQVRA